MAKYIIYNLTKTGRIKDTLRGAAQAEFTLSTPDFVGRLEEQVN